MRLGQLSFASFSFVVVLVLAGGRSAAQLSAADFTHVVVDGSTPDSLQVVAAGDLNGDGFADLIVGSGNFGQDGDLFWYEDRSSAGLWQRHVIASAAQSLGRWSTDAQAIDVDGDGDQDVVTSDWYLNQRVVWFENLDGLGTSWAFHPIGSPRAHDLSAADLDRDGDVDLVTRQQTGEGGKLEFWRQDAGGWTHSTFDLASLSAGEGLTVGDLDRDGDLDVILPRYWYENTGGVLGGWVEHEYAPSFTQLEAVVQTGDVNRDGRLDIVLTSAEVAGQHDGVTAWYRAPANPVTGVWTERVIDQGFEEVTHTLALGDMNLDGTLDVVTAEMHTSSGPDEVRIYENVNGSGTSWRKVVIDDLGSHNAVVLDVGGDGDLDILGANWTSFTQADMWENHLSDGSMAPYCMGNRSCPCANSGGAGGGCGHSGGQGARLYGAGTSSVASDGLILVVEDVPGQRPLLAFMGNSSTNVPLGDGRRCLGGSIFRFAPGSSDAVGHYRLGPGLVQTSVARFRLEGHIAPGATWRFQTWFRDPNGPCGSGFNLTNALAVLFRP